MQTVTAELRTSRSAEQAARLRNWARAYTHWLKAGQTDRIARALASVLWGIDADVKLWGDEIRRKETTIGFDQLV